MNKDGSAWHNFKYIKACGTAVFGCKIQLIVMHHSVIRPLSSPFQH